MARTTTSLAKPRLLASTAVVAGAGLFAPAALAQTYDLGFSPHVSLVIPPDSPPPGAEAETTTLAASADELPDDILELGALIEKTSRLSLNPVIENRGVCEFAAVEVPSTDVNARCPFDNRKMGISASSEFELPDAQINLRTAFGQRSDAVFSLDNQFLDRWRGTSTEYTMATLGASVDLFDGAVEVGSEFGWSNRWRAPLVDHPSLEHEYDRTRGTTQLHTMKVALADSRDLKLSLNGSYSRSDGRFLPLVLDSPAVLFAMPGEEWNLGGRARFEGFDLRASIRSNQNDIYSQDRWRISAAHSGIKLHLRRDRTSSERSEIAGFVTTASENSRWRAGIDFTPMTLFPEIAMDIEGWGALMPQTIGFEYGKRDRSRIGASGIDQTRSSMFAANGFWISPLGETLITYDLESQRGISSEDPPLRARDSNFMIDHSFDLGDWSLGANILINNSSAGDRALSDTDNSFTYYGLSARYRVKDGVEFDFSIGRDALAFESDAGAFQFRDRTTRIEASIDFSQMLQSRFNRSDIHLRLEGRLDLGKSGFEVRYFDELLLDEFETSNAQGVLLTFGMRLH